MAATAFNSSVFNVGTVNNPGLKDQIRTKTLEIAELLKAHFEGANDFYEVVSSHLNTIRDYVFDEIQLPSEWQEEFPLEFYNRIKHNIDILKDLVETFDNQALYNNIRNRGHLDAAKESLKNYLNDVLTSEALYNNNNESYGGRRRSRHKTRKARRAHKKHHTRRHRSSAPKRQRTLRRKN